MSPSKDALGMEPEWNETMAEPGRDPDICLGAKQEHAPHHDGPPHEVAATMFGPLLVLSVFAVGLGFAGMPGDHNFFHHLIDHSSQKVVEHHALFNLGPIPVGSVMIGSIVVAALGILASWSLFSTNPIAGERKLRRTLGGLHTLFAQKFYMDHFWAWAVSKTMMTGAKVAAWFDDDIIDGGVRGSGLMTALLGEKIRKEHSGLVAHYLFMLVASVLLLTALLASVEPDFVLSPSRIFDISNPGTGGGLIE